MSDPIKRSATTLSPAPVLDIPKDAALHSGFFVLRTPLLPIDDLLRWSAGAPDRDILRDRLRQLIQRKEIVEALFHASPSTVESLPYWWSAPDSERGQKVERTLVRYLARMTTRSTPFGLFAGCSLGRITTDRKSQPFSIELAPLRAYRRHTRLDGDFLSALGGGLLADSTLRRKLRYRPNTSLYRAAGRWRYIEERQSDEQSDDAERRVRSYHLVAIEPSPFLDRVLDVAATSPQFWELTQVVLAQDGSVSEADAEIFINELIDCQILVAELAPPVTGDAPLHTFLRGLEEAHPEDTKPEPMVRLRAASAELQNLDQAGLGIETDRYREIRDSLHGHPTGVDIGRLLQVDLYKPTVQATLNESIVREALRAVYLLHRLAEPTPNPELVHFRDAFLARYEGRAVPLLEALDEELGIGFAQTTGKIAAGEPLLRGLRFPQPSTPSSLSISLRQRALRDIACRALRSGTTEVELTEADLASLRPAEPPLPLPDAFAVMATVIGSAQAIQQGDFRILIDGVSGPSGANLLGRFCHLDDTLTKQVRAHLLAEEALRPDAIFAEIVHLSEGRMGNILARPVLRSYEIPFLGQSGAPADHQIELADLQVSVVNRRIVLSSQRHGREVLPRLTSAHNFAAPRNLGVYRFLCALQKQGVAGHLSWDWGAMNDYEFLPRVVVGRLILSPARWHLDSKHLGQLRKAKGEAADQEIQELRRRLALPRRVCLADGDNLLPLDLENPLCIEALVDLLKGRLSATIEEFLPDAGELAVTGPEGHFRHELILPFVRRTPAIEPAALNPKAAYSRTEVRSYPPGSEWLYAKLYSGPATVDGLLRGPVASLVEKARERGLVDRWFFIRYGDPDWHLRLRFHGSPKLLYGQLLPLLHDTLAPCLAAGSVHKVQLDTYEPELERYAGPVGMALAERLFEADSDAVLALLKLLLGDEGLEQRWRVAFFSTDALLTDLFGKGRAGLAASQAVLDDLLRGLDAEFRVDTALRKQIGERFRRERPWLEALIGPVSTPSAVTVRRILDQRSQRLESIVTELRACEVSERLHQSVEALAGSYVHMHTNRLFRSAGRAQELVLYQLLKRWYASNEQIAM